MRVKSIMYISPMAKSLDKAREEQKAVRRGGAIEGVLGFLSVKIAGPVSPV